MEVTLSSWQKLQSIVVQSRQHGNLNMTTCILCTYTFHLIILDSHFYYNQSYISPYMPYSCGSQNQYLKLPSLFAAGPFWTFHTKSHNMKAVVILSHLWSPFRPLTCLYGKNELLWVSVQPSGVFSWQKTPLRLPMQITWPWPPVGSFSHGLITVRQKKMWT